MKYLHGGNGVGGMGVSRVVLGHTKNSDFAVGLIHSPVPSIVLY